MADFITNSGSFKARVAIFLFSLLSFHISLNAQKLQSYIEEAQQNNPQVAAYELRYEGVLEQANAASLPNTEFSAGYFASQPETRTGAQVARFTVRQMLPWFGTIAAQRQSASAAAEAENVEITIIRRKIGLEVAKSYYKLYAIQAKEKVLQQQIELLKTYEELALTSVEVGEASAVDVLRLQIRQNELQQRQEILQQEYLAGKVSFNNLLNREQRQKVDLRDSLFIPQEQFVGEVGDFSINPELVKYDKLYEAVAQAEEANRKEATPMLGVGLDYVPVSERPGMNFNDNGKDIIMPMLSVSVPIFNSSYRSQSRQNELRQNELLAQKDNRSKELESRFADAKSSLETAKISYFTKEKNLKAAKNAEEILLKNYETGTIDFTDVLEIQELQLQFQLEQQEALRDYFVNAATINYLINE